MSPPKSSKKKKIKNQETPFTPKPWPNLPHPLTTQLERNVYLMQNITSFGCVTKRWRSPSKRCTKLAQLVEIQPRENRSGHKLGILFRPAEYFPGLTTFSKKSYKEPCPQEYFKGHYDGTIVSMSMNTSRCYLRVPSACGEGFRCLPDWIPSLVFKLATLTPRQPPEDRYGHYTYNVMVVTGNHSPAFAFFKREPDSDFEWELENCDVREPYLPAQNMRFCNAVGLGGRFYALSLQGSVAVIEEVDYRFRITRVGKNRAVPCKVSRQFREYLMESDGEILLVFLVSRKSIDVVDDDEVFRLDVEELLWVRVEGIGNRALFVEEECGMWVNASKVGCMKNCVYFTHHGVDKWLVFDMESSHISPAFTSESENKKFVMWGESILETE